MAKGVLKSYQKAVTSILSFFLEMKGYNVAENDVQKTVNQQLATIIPSAEIQKNF